MNRRANSTGRLLRTIVILHAAVLLLGAILPITGRTFPGVAGYFFTWDMFPGYATENGRWIILARFSDGQWRDLSSGTMLQYREHAFAARVPGDADTAVTPGDEPRSATPIADNAVASPVAAVPVAPPFVDFTRADVDRVGRSLPVLARTLAKTAAQRSGTQWVELLIVQRYRRGKFSLPPDDYARRFGDRWSPGWRSRIVFRETNPPSNAKQFGDDVAPVPVPVPAPVPAPSAVPR